MWTREEVPDFSYEDSTEVLVKRASDDRKPPLNPVGKLPVQDHQ